MELNVRVHPKAKRNAVEALPFATTTAPDHVIALPVRTECAEDSGQLENPAKTRGRLA